ncbi:hypothetical protein KVT40_001784 [Elsinoe batatas]|uniref:Uncharacterized protein n=1 Tax=Elsinoe batatas TaxID=2601811 RepID=A0A8K0PFC7_9PEZI|nr:hypothetical protein KVT40_001784 [Elsinoe batatas]
MRINRWGQEVLIRPFRKPVKKTKTTSSLPASTLDTPMGRGTVQTSKIFGIPPELRYQIWEHVYSKETITIVLYRNRPKQITEPTKRHLANMLLTCVLFSRETSSLFHHNITLSFRYSKTLRSFSLGISATLRQILTRLEVQEEWARIHPHPYPTERWATLGTVLGSFPNLERVDQSLVKQDIWPESFYSYRKWQRTGKTAGTFRGLKELKLAITNPMTLQHGMSLSVIPCLVKYMNDVCRKCDVQRKRNRFEGEFAMRVSVPSPPTEKTFAWKIWEIKAYGCVKVLWLTRSDARPGDRHRYDDDDRPAKKARIGDKVNLLDLPDEILQKICVYFYKTQYFHLVVPGDRFRAAIAPPLDRKRLSLVIVCRRLTNMALWALYAHSGFIFGGRRALVALAIRQPEVKYLIRRAAIQQLFDPYGESTTRTDYMFAGQILRHFTQLTRIYLMICRSPELALAPHEGESYFIENHLTRYFTRGLRMPTRGHGVSQMKVTVVVQANERRDDPENEKELIAGQKDLRDGKIVLGFNCTAGIRYYQLCEATEAVSFVCQSKHVVLSPIAMGYSANWVSNYQVEAPGGSSWTKGEHCNEP